MSIFRLNSKNRSRLLHAPSVGWRRNRWIIFYYIVLWRIRFGALSLVASSSLGLCLGALVAYLRLGNSKLNPPKAKIMWRLSFFTTIWAIWKERNRRCFEGKCYSATKVVDRERFYVASQVSILPPFRGLSVDILC